jgi:hypothetical protein
MWRDNMGKEDYWNKFTNSGNVFDYLAYKVQESKNECNKTQVGVDTNGAVNCCDGSYFNKRAW